MFIKNMEEYSFQKLETKWQNYWKKNKIFEAKEKTKKPKFYVLDMFPYPSGTGLHVGHIRGYIATDVFSKMKIMQGYNALHPMGWDAFGLPAENYAIKNKIHPEAAVKKNIKTFKEQINKIGIGYDWSREINTTDPNYYKWTQWIFLKMFEKGLAYESFEPINWCPSCKTGLANEDLEGNKCERCETIVEKKPLRQWVLKITQYADRLLEGLKFLDWEEFIIEQQKNWIGRSEGAIINFQLSASNLRLGAFTTRLDTIFGCTYLVLAPEHPFVALLLKIKNKKLKIKNKEEVKNYIEEANKKTDLERIAEKKEKTGIKLQGIETINPFNNEKMPVFIADYVLPHYGTGAIMAVPAHDKRDFEFAKNHNLPIKQVIAPTNIDNAGSDALKQTVFEDDGILINSGRFTGLESEEARKKMLEWLRGKKLGQKKVYYKMRDWIFSRQRYWGEPIPLVFCENCAVKIKNKKLKIKNKELSEGEFLNPGWIQIPHKALPLGLPRVRYYQPTGTGDSPLANIKNWVNTKCPKCGGKAKRETNTMPQWAGSCWYYLRYIDPKNTQELVNKNKEKHWMPVDLYVGGAEHATRHLIYARFWHKFLYDIKAVSNSEPFKRLINVGLILAPDGRKMSKRWNNVINPDDIVKNYGADTLRVYEMFLGPFTDATNWNPQGILGVKRFLEKVYKLRARISADKDTNKNVNIERLIHKTIKKTSEDIENFKFNTAVSQLMILVNELEKQKAVKKEHFEILIKLLAPFAPHLMEEFWKKLSGATSIFLEKWPQYNKNLIKDKAITLLVLINGKLRDKINVEVGFSEEKARTTALSREKVKKWLNGKTIRKTIFVPDKLINFVL